MRRDGKRGHERECQRCHTIEWTASQAPFCRMCKEANDRDEAIRLEPVRIESAGYKALKGPWKDKHGHRCYTVLTPCGHEWTLPFTNFLKQTKNAKAKGLPPACGTCGPKHRMDVALHGYIEKFGRDYDLNTFKGYVKEVRCLTNENYRKHKKIINPKNHKRGLKDYHVDHITSIVEAFKHGWTAERTAAVENLQMLPWKDNLSKGRFNIT